MNTFFQRSAIYSGIFALFGLYYIFYFLPFNDGRLADSYSVLFLLLKILGLSLIIAGFGLSLKLRPWAFLLCLGYSLSLILILIRWHSGWAFEDKLFANLYLQLPLVFILTKGPSGDTTKLFYKAFAIFIVVQVLLEIAFRTLGLSLWSENRSAGGLGNPTSFGLACLISLLYFYHTPTLNPIKIGLIILLEWGIFLSGSLAAYLTLYGAFILSVILQPHRRKTGAILFCAVILNKYIYDLFWSKVNNISFIQADHITNKFNAIQSFTQKSFAIASKHNTVTSSSISDRIDQHLIFMQSALSDWSIALFGGVGKHVYWIADSQYLTYFASYGILFGLFFVGFNLYALKKALKISVQDNGFSLSVLLFMNLVFLTSRVLDYFPIATVYLITLSVVFYNSTYKNTSWMATSGSASKMSSTL